MEENKAAETRSYLERWAPHFIIAVATAIIMVVLLAVQPWSGNAITVVHSFRMSISLDNMEGWGMSGKAVQEMAYAAPDRSHITLNPGDENQEIVIIGEDLYANDERYLAGYKSMAIPISIAAVVPSKEHTRTTLEGLTDVEELAIERIDGVTCRHYRGRMDFTHNIEEQIASLDPEQPNYDAMVETLNEQIEMVRQIETDIEVWVGKDDGLVRQIYHEMQMPPETGGPSSIASTLIRYYDINVPLAIEAPLDSYGELLPGWYLVGGPAREASFFVVIDADITELKYRQTGIHIIVYNTGDVAVDNVRIDMKKPEDCRDSNPGCWISAIPAVIVIDNNVQMNPGDSMVFVAEYKYDETDSKVKELIEKAKVRITYIMDGRGNTRIYSAGSPYPEAVPP